MLGTDLGAVPGLRFTHGLPQVDARTVREEDLTLPGAGHAAEAGRASRAVNSVAGLGQGVGPDRKSVV